MTKQISSGKAVWTSFLVDLGDIILNVIVMMATGSVVMLAEAFEGLSDLVASGLLLLGLRVSKRRANKKHPFGFGKALFFWTLISAIVMLIFGAGLSVYFGTMYIGSEKLLVHLDINVQSGDQQNLEQTVEKIKEHIRKEVPVVYSIQVETRILPSP